MCCSFDRLFCCTSTLNDDVGGGVAGVSSARMGVGRIVYRGRSC